MSKIRTGVDRYGRPVSGVCQKVQAQKVATGNINRQSNRLCDSDFAMTRNICFLSAVLLAHQPAFAADAANRNVQSHLPQRPLPKAVDRPLTRGPAYYVHPSRGDDSNNGSMKKPWKSMQHAVRRLKPGDTLYLRDGVYHEKVYLTQSGTADAPIVIAAYPNELPILDGGLSEFLNSPAKSWRPAKEGAPGEYVSTKTYPDAADRQVPHQFLPGA